MWIFGGVVVAVVVALLVLDWVVAGRGRGRIARRPPTSISADYEAAPSMLRRGETGSQSGT
jgi:hypothetical protein